MLFKVWWIHMKHLIACYIKTLNVREPSLLGSTRSISWLLMSRHLASPGHQQLWYWLCRIGKSLSYLRKDFNYLCHINVEEWHKMWIYVLCSLWKAQHVKGEKAKICLYRWCFIKVVCNPRFTIMRVNIQWMCMPCMYPLTVKTLEHIHLFALLCLFGVTELATYIYASLSALYRNKYY